MLWLYALSAIAIMAAGPRFKDTRIDQIDVKVAKARLAAAQQIRNSAVIEDQKKLIGVNQLPSTLQSDGDDKEDTLVSKTSPGASLTADVVEAWNQIRQRGQTPTPDLIAREIGPDKLAEFLASSPVAASILATGTLPDQAPQPEAGRKEGGVTVIPPPNNG